MDERNPFALVTCAPIVGDAIWVVFALAFSSLLASRQTRHEFVRACLDQVSASPEPDPHRAGGEQPPQLPGGADPLNATDQRVQPVI